MIKKIIIAGCVLVACVGWATLYHIPITDGKMTVTDHKILMESSLLNYALLFNKSQNDWLYTSQNFTNLFTVTDTSCSILIWVKLQDIAGDQEYGFLTCSRDINADGSWIYEVVKGWGEDYFILRLNSATETVKSTAGFTLHDDGLWHLIGVVKSNNVYTFWKDATNDTPSTVSTVSSAYGTLYIGNDGPNFSASRDMNGGMRRVLIYNRAVSALEITNLYNGGIGTASHPENGLVATWLMDEGTGTNVADSVDGNTAHFGAGTQAPVWTNWAQ